MRIAAVGPRNICREMSAQLCQVSLFPSEISLWALPEQSQCSNESQLTAKGSSHSLAYGLILT